MFKGVKYIGFLGLFAIAAVNSANAGRYSNCLKCHDFSTVFKSNKDAINMFVKEGGVNIGKELGGGVLSGSDSTFFEKLSNNRLEDMPSLFAVIPESESAYRKIYDLDDDVSVKPEELERMEYDRVMLAFTYRQKTHFAATGGRSDIVDFIDNSTDKNLVFLGHNDGGNFRLPNGEFFSLSEMDEQCMKKHKNCIFISCQSKNYIKTNLSVKFDVSYAEATEIAFDTASWIMKNGGNDIGKNDLGLELDAIVEKARLTTLKVNVKNALPGVVIFGGIAGVGVVVGIGDNQSGTSKNPPSTSQT